MARKVSAEDVIAEDTNQYGTDRKDGQGLAQVGGGQEGQGGVGQRDVLYDLKLGELGKLEGLD